MGFSGGRLATHIADIEAHTKNMFEESISGRWAMGLPLGTISTLNLANNILYAIPFFVAHEQSYSDIGIYITALEAGKLARLGVYKLGANLLPSELVFDAGEVSLTLAQERTRPLAPLILPKGWYATAVISDSTGVAALRASKRAWSPWGWGVNINGTNHMYEKAQAYGVLPDPFGVGNFADYDMFFVGLKTS